MIVVTALLAAAAGAWAAHLFQARREARLRADHERDREALVGTLASGLAHEMRNPLSTLRMHLQLLQEDWAAPVTEREKANARRLDGVLREIKRLEDTLDDFLRFAVQQRLNRKPVNLHRMIAELLEILAPKLSEFGVRPVDELPPDLPTVEADPALLRHALLNLVLNACEAGGGVTLRAERRDGEVAIHVVDSGSGIAPEHRDRVFEAYFSTKPSGTGLGLPTAKRIVEQHGGRLTFETEAGRGSTFTVHLPIHEDARPDR